jgi:hypothetical protein
LTHSFGKCTVAERAAFNPLTIRISGAGLNTVNDVAARVFVAAPGQAFKTIIAVIQCLLIALVADRPWKALKIAAAEGRLRTVFIDVARTTHELANFSLLRWKVSLLIVVPFLH